MCVCVRDDGLEEEGFFQKLSSAWQAAGGFNKPKYNDGVLTTHAHISGSGGALWDEARLQPARVQLPFCCFRCGKRSPYLSVLNVPT